MVGNHEDRISCDEALKIQVLMYVSNFKKHHLTKMLIMYLLRLDLIILLKKHTLFYSLSTHSSVFSQPLISLTGNSSKAVGISLPHTS